MTRLLGERYDLQEQIGGGGMAVVYRAIDTLLGRQVAVKMLRSQYSGDEEFVNRFRREAQSAASLSHPNIVNVYDVGVTDHGEYYLVMEYVDGPTLKEVIRKKGHLSVPETIDVTKQICDALEHAHDRRIIHRDIKPHNILLTKSMQVKVTDFGIAHASSGNTITHHHSNSVLGSVHYFSPEQARGGPTDVKSDIYSLGIVMYEMLTGQLPFSGDSPVSVALKHLREHFVEPRELNASIPQSVENIVLRCLVKSPELRYPDMKSVKMDLQKALNEPNVPKFIMPAEVTDETIAVPIVGGPRAAVNGGVDADMEGKRKPRWWSIVGWSAVAVAVLIVGAVLAYNIVMGAIKTPDMSLPDVRGKDVADAVKILEQDGFQASQIKESHAISDKPKGQVYDQDPEGPSKVKQGRMITLWVSDGPQQVQMPNLVGLPVDEAIQSLVNMGIPKNQIQQQTVQNTQYSAGTVVGTTPDKDQPISADTTIILQVSQGNMVAIPNIIGMTLDQATQALATANLQVGHVNYMTHDGPDNVVFDTAPYKPGYSVPTGSSIDLYVTQNNGESGGAAGSGNSTTSTGSGGPQLPPDAVTKTVDVQVKDKNGASIHVQIYTTDVLATRQLQVDETITATKSWTLTLYVTPSKNGEIIVMQNGVQTYEKTITATS